MSNTLPKFLCPPLLAYSNSMFCHCHHNMNWSNCESLLGRRAHCILYHVSSLPRPQHCQAYFSSRQLTRLGKWAGRCNWRLGTVLPAAGSVQGPKTQLTGLPNWFLCPFRCQVLSLTSDMSFSNLSCLSFPRARALKFCHLHSARENLAVPLGAN